MKKDKKLIMDINHETAMRLWNKSFGKEIKATDFAGRKIAKSAYGDRNSEFGWNVDHIYPQTLGGKTAEHNLIICNIKTNDEKADKFPGFVANGNKFTIVKVENHYEIKLVGEKKNKAKEEEKYNFYDSASGVRFFKKAKKHQENERFVASICITIKGIKDINSAITDFIEELFSTENIQFLSGSFGINSMFYSDSTNVQMIVKDYNVSMKQNINDLLDKCIVLNTYAKYYFRPMKCIDDLFIEFRVDNYVDRRDMFRKDKDLRFLSEYSRSMNNSRLRINNLVIENSYAKDDIDTDKLSSDTDSFYDYDYIMSRLAENLEKEVNRSK